uniref:F-box domain-containing protein n=1 Tax=Oryza rufipogon TaxID=4529 RepID=A0A0E0P7W8_ORYRU
MEHLSEELIIEILKRITRTSDLNSVSLVSKQLYAIDAEQRATICIGCGLSTEDFSALCSRFPNLLKVEIDYSGSTPGNGNHIDNQEVTSSGLLMVAFGCKALSSLYLNDCKGIAGSTEWLEYLGSDGSLEELIVSNCKGVSQYNFLKFGPGWMKLKTFEYENKENFFSIHPRYGSSVKANTHRYELCCENLKDLKLVRLVTEPDGPEIGLRFLLGKCKALEKLCLEYVTGVIDNDMIVLSQACKNLKSISLWLKPEHYVVGGHIEFRTGFTDESLKALALNCPLLQDVELTFTGCAHWDPPEIGFTQEGLVSFVESCPIRVLVLNGALFFNNKGMKALSSAQFLETLSLIDCNEVTDHGMRFIVHFPSLINLTLRFCHNVTDAGLSELAHAQKLQSLDVGGCGYISQKGVLGAAKSVYYEVNCKTMATTPTTTTTTPSAARLLIPIAAASRASFSTLALPRSPYPSPAPPPPVAAATSPSHGDHADHHHHHPLRRRIARFLLHPRPLVISLSLSRSAAAGCRGHLAGAASKCKGAGVEENKKGQEQEEQERRLRRWWTARRRPGRKRREEEEGIRAPRRWQRMLYFSMEHLSEELIIQILKRITRTSDLNSLSLVSKQLYTIDAEQRATIRLHCGLATEAFPTLCSRFPNLLKVEIDYSGWTSGNGSQIDNQCLLFLSSRCTLLNDVTLSFCSNISDPGIACLTYCKKLMSLRLNSIPELTSLALSSVYLNDCKGIAGSTEWLEHLGANGSLEELAVKNCKGIG